jgi:hypothetical protein
MSSSAIGSASAACEAAITEAKRAVAAVEQGGGWAVAFDAAERAAKLQARLGALLDAQQQRLDVQQQRLGALSARLDGRLAEAVQFEAALEAVDPAEKAPLVREWLTARGLL